MSGGVRILALGADEKWQVFSAPHPPPDQAAWYVFADAGSILHPDLAALLRVHGANRPDIEIFYGDEVIAADPGEAPEYVCKPAFDLTQLLAQDYIGLPFAVRGRAVAGMADLAANANAAQCYGFLLEAAANGLGIDRITEVLAFNPGRRRPVLAALRRILPRLNPGCQALQGLSEASIEIRRQFDSFPDVTLIIPTRQVRQRDGDSNEPHPPMVLKLLEGLCGTDWPMDRLNVLIGDDVADGAIYESRPWPFRLARLITTRSSFEGFNYAHKANSLWRAAGSEHLVFLNDDLLVRDPCWMKALMTFAVDESVGGVGARLLYPDDTIQHAGMAAGLMGTCGHAFIGAPASSPTYQNWAVVQREWSMVTGAVFATRRSVLSQVNGFDERFSLNYNDVDLCLRLRLLGYRIVYTPHAEFTHFESASRGKAPSPADQTALFLEKWQDYIKDDPAYHPHLTRSTHDIHAVPPTRAWWRGIAS
jgi:hypothetical protein